MGTGTKPVEVVRNFPSRVASRHRRVRSKSLSKLWRLLLLVFILAFYSNVLAEDSKEVLEAEGVYKQCLRIEKDSTTKKIILVRQLLEDDKIGDWEKYDSKKDAEYNDEVHLFFVGKRLSSARVRWGTPTGDWAKFTYYYYRENKALAYIINDYRTFCYGELRIVSRYLFNAAGKRIKLTKEFYDLITDKSIKGNDAIDDPPEVFLRTKDILKAFKYSL